MVIGSDPTIQPATILITIEASRAHFESLIANMSMMPPSGASGGDLGTMAGRGMVVDSNAGSGVAAANSGLGTAAAGFER